MDEFIGLFKNFKWRYLAYGLFGFMFLIFLTRSCTQVGTGERGVVTHFGAVSPNILGEGLHFYFPIGTEVHRISVKTVLTNISAEAASKDMQTVKVSVAINWHLTPDQVANVYQHIGDESAIEAVILTPALNEVFKAATAEKDAEAILTERADLVLVVDSRMKEWVQRYGITVDDISVINIDFSADFDQAIESKQVAQQQAEQAQYLADKAKKDAEAVVNTARGQAEAQRLVVQSLTHEILQSKAIDKWDGHFPQVMGSGSLPFINLRNSKGTTVGDQ